MKKFMCAVLATTFLTVSMPKAKAAEIVAISAYGTVATLAIYLVGYAGFGTGYMTLALAGNNVRYKAENYERTLDVVASNDSSLIDRNIREFLDTVRKTEPRLQNTSDIAILAAVVDAINGK